MPCEPLNISLPTGPSGPPISGFGVPFSIGLPNINPFPAGFPEDLLDILNSLQLLLPSGPLLPPLNLNFGKDIFDAIMKLLDQFMPFLMLYKFFLAILNIIVCIIEVICAIPNPFKLIPVVIKLFTQCIPAFLLLFPIFAIIIMIISLILLLIALIEYIIEKIIALVLLLLRNILALINAFQEFNVNSVIAIAQKIGASLCIFQNLFVLLAIFNVIIQVIKDILSLSFAIPPCEDNNPASCCTSDVCPSIAKDPFTASTGTLLYLNGAGVTLPNVPAPFNSISVRSESWQLYDLNQNISSTETFSNVYNAFDVTPDPTTYPGPYYKQVFFPTSSTFNANTPANQAAYTVNMRLFYNPVEFGRKGLARYIRINNCVVLSTPTPTYSDYNNNAQSVPTGVVNLAGGLVFEDDGKTAISGYAPDGVTAISDQGTLGTFLHKPTVNSASPTLSPSDGYTFNGNVEYTFTPNAPILMSANLITLGCIPSVAIPKNFVNTMLAGNIAVKTADLNNIINGPNFPQPDVAQQCLTNALNTLRTNITTAGATEFQSTATACMQTLLNQANAALASLVQVGFEPCQSTFTISPAVQFTTQPITIQVSLNENNGLPLTKGITSNIAASLAPMLKAYPTFGSASEFVYDGYQYFNSQITSPIAGSGEVMVSFDNNIFCKNDTSIPEHTLQVQNYQFVYTPSQGQIVPIGNDIAVGDRSGGNPERDISDLAKDGN